MDLYLNIGMELIESFLLVTFCVVTWVIYPVILFTSEE